MLLLSRLPTESYLASILQSCTDKDSHRLSEPVFCAGPGQG